MTERSKTRDFRPIRVQEAWDETPGLRGLRLEPDAEFGQLHRHPGQLVHVHVPGSRPGLFALANGPGAGQPAELLVRRGNAIADAIVTAAQPGTWLKITPPHGPGFSIDEAQGRNMLLVATGSGITPIRALIQDLLGRREEIGRVTLLYGQRSEADFAYQREHADWERANIQVALYGSRAGADWRGRHGHVQDALQDPEWKGPLQDTVAYLSGHPAMIASTKEQLAARGVPPNQIHLNF